MLGVSKQAAQQQHILLGLAREGQGVAMKALTGQGVDPDRAREAVLRLIP